MAPPSKSKSTVGTSNVPRTSSSSSSVGTTGGQWSKTAAKIKGAKLDNACPGPSYDGEKIDWARISNTDRPILSKTGGTGQSAKGLTR